MGQARAPTHARARAACDAGGACARGRARPLSFDRRIAGREARRGAAPAGAAAAPLVYVPFRSAGVAGQAIGRRRQEQSGGARRREPRRAGGQGAGDVCASSCVPGRRGAWRSKRGYGASRAARPLGGGAPARSCGRSPRARPRGARRRGARPGSGRGSRPWRSGAVQVQTAAVGAGRPAGGPARAAEPARARLAGARAVGEEATAIRRARPPGRARAPAGPGGRGAGPALGASLARRSLAHEGATRREDGPRGSAWRGLACARPQPHGRRGGGGARPYQVPRALCMRARGCALGLVPGEHTSLLGAQSGKERHIPLATPGAGAGRPARGAARARRRARRARGGAGGARGRGPARGGPARPAAVHVRFPPGARSNQCCTRPRVTK